MTPEQGFESILLFFCAVIAVAYILMYFNTREKLYLLQNEQKPKEIFLPGDIVLLKSGGPHMVVARIENSGKINVVWYDTKQPLTNSDGLLWQSIPPEVLTKINKDNGI